jgi:hypothetical protein
MDLNKLTEEQKRDLTKNPNTPPETLSLLAKDEVVDVRWNVAKNPNTPPETLTILAKDENSCVRSWVARNPNTPQEVLILLAKDEDYYIRSGVARNPNIPASELEKFITSIGSYGDMMYVMYRNTGLPAFNYSRTVRALASNIKTPSKILEEIERHVDINDNTTYELILKNPSCSEILKNYIIAKRFMNMLREKFNNY